MNFCLKRARRRIFSKFVLLAGSRTGSLPESCVTRTLITGLRRIRSVPHHGRSSTSCADCRRECPGAPCCYTRLQTRSLASSPNARFIQFPRDYHDRQRCRKRRRFNLDLSGPPSLTANAARPALPPLNARVGAALWPDSSAYPTEQDCRHHIVSPAQPTSVDSRLPLFPACPIFRKGCTETPMGQACQRRLSRTTIGRCSQRARDKVLSCRRSLASKGQSLDTRGSLQPGRYSPRRFFRLHPLRANRNPAQCCSLFS